MRTSPSRGSSAREGPSRRPRGRRAVGTELGRAVVVPDSGASRLVGVVDADGRLSRLGGAETLGVPAFRDPRAGARPLCPPTWSCSSRRPRRTGRSPRLALAAGCHVISEKPLALDLADARRSRQSTRPTGPPHRWWRRTTAFGGSRARSQTLVPSGALGRAARDPDRLAGAISGRLDLARATGADGCRTRTSSTWRSTTSTCSGMITGREVVEVDAAAAGACRTRRSGTTRTSAALLTLADGTPVVVRGHLGRAARRDVLERRLGARRRAGRVPPGRAASTTPCADRAVRAATASLPERVALPALPALDRLGVLAELRRAIADGRRAGDARPPTTSRASRDPRARPLDRERRPSESRRSSRREDRPLPGAVPRSAARGGPRRRGRCRLRRRRDRLAARRAPLPACRAPRRPLACERAMPSPSGLEISALSCHGNPLHPDAAIAAAGDRRLPPTPCRLAAELGRRDGDHVLRLPRRVGALHAARAGSPAPGRTTSRRRSTGSGRTGRCRTGSRRPRSHARTAIRVAIEPHPGFVVYNTASMLAAARRRGRRRRRRTSTLRTSSGRGWTHRVRARPRRGDLPRAREGHGLRRGRLAVERRARDDPGRPARRAKLELPLRRRRAPGRLLARPRGRAAGRRLRRRALDRARGPAALARGRPRPLPSRRCARRLPREVATRPSAPRPTSPARCR